MRYSDQVMVNHMRHTHAQTAERRSHHVLKQKTILFCSSCGAPKLNHTVCLNCGKYNGRVVIDVHAALAKKEKKMKERSQAK